MTKKIVLEEIIGLVKVIVVRNQTKKDLRGTSKLARTTHVSTIQHNYFES
jgi:hypothetical protein